VRSPGHMRQPFISVSMQRSFSIRVATQWDKALVENFSQGRYVVSTVYKPLRNGYRTAICSGNRC